MPHDSAFEFDTATILRGPAHQWRVQCRLWNVDAGPTPREQRQYILARTCPVLLDTVTAHLTEADLLDSFDIRDTPHVADAGLRGRV